ncbi:Ribonuclease MRP protein subunit rmp1 [Friedmanniomyces endolithicus]|uniref:Ribonuclease MRP protein subunit rmp1 n=1 Tax=Rachicladosporium monterosium TaxID=1507873 RepID=A0ABR0KZZ1_9PEZI|nr:Ribonuclease MRP protein subunit rmp1 [Friedmanniomyces endolithicus]KAK5141283.1 Ribonuclease MRP protein subunit rmp1 [Rachicladosporium monterosium]
MENTASRVSKEDSVHLQHLSDVLHLFHHRNQNQHRRSTWWRPFSIFRKQVRDLCALIESLHEKPTTHLARSKKQAQDQRTTDQLQQILVFWRDVLGPKWQHAFSQVAADAEVCRIVGITAAFEELGQAEVEKVIERFAEEGFEGRTDVGPSILSGQSEDVGELVTRHFVGLDVPSMRPVAKAGVEQALASQHLTQSTSKRNVLKRSRKNSIESPAKVRRRGKKGDAIDDLFSGLG